jgi:hypothetical protein
MGILWTVWPTDDKMKEWLDSEDIEYPQEPSRFPKGKEVKEVLNNLVGYKVKIYDNGIGNTWQADIHSEVKLEEWTLLNISEYSGDEESQEIWFEKGHEDLIKLILKRLSEICGPLVLIDDAGCEPQVINA